MVSESVFGAKSTKYQSVSVSISLYTIVHLMLVIDPEKLRPELNLQNLVDFSILKQHVW